MSARRAVVHDAAAEGELARRLPRWVLTRRADVDDAAATVPADPARVAELVLDVARRAVPSFTMRRR